MPIERRSMGQAPGAQENSEAKSRASHRISPVHRKGKRRRREEEEKGGGEGREEEKGGGEGREEEKGGRRRREEEKGGRRRREGGGEGRRRREGGGEGREEEKGGGDVLFGEEERREAGPPEPLILICERPNAGRFNVNNIFCFTHQRDPVFGDQQVRVITTGDSLSEDLKTRPTL
ncbi:hypothetical protein NHX12_027825 [Muraenolepis orangiensis]|uniref:Uncharacterized protein n=1 Tax=Muraenolepis orangiensis TaxID=630683 RepID=A0A9Q0EFE0_9TELE|nr:hypothetical protein NHX12_027825 [Muraenolepis orangiensis]